MNINRDYLIINDVKKSNIKLDNGSMFFYITDKNTQNIFVNLVINVSNNDLIQKYANIENAEDYTLTMNIVKPDNTYKIVEGKLHDKEKAIFEFDLKEDCVDKIGTYKCELLTKCNINDHEEITTSNKLTYKVKSSVLNDLDEIQEAPEYPLVIQLFDKLSDIEQYEEDRRANELARQLAEEQRQQRFNELDTNMVDRVNAMDSKMDDVEARISAKEQAVDKLIVDTKKDIDDYKVAKDTEIDEYKTAKDQQIDQAITNQNNKIDDAIANQNNKIDTAIAEQNNRIETVESNDTVQDNRLDELEAKDIAHETRITNIEAKNIEQDNRLDSIEAVNVSQDNRLDAIEVKNQQQDDRLLDIEKVNKRQDMNLKCLFAESKNNMIDVTEEGNSIYLQNSTTGYTLIDEIKGNTMVNCNKEADKEIILNGNINTQGYSNVTLTEGVDGGLVDIALEGNTMVNVCDQKDPVAITKSYTVETGNHVALQGEYDGKCRPVVAGNTLVNLARYNNSKPTTTLTEWYNSYQIADTSLFKEGVEYTLIYNLKIDSSSNSAYDSMNLGFGEGDTMTEGMPNFQIFEVNNGINILKFTFTNPNNRSSFIIRPLRRNTAPVEGESAIYSYKDLIILEGDYTNKPIPGYFEGLQSSFEDKVVTQEMVDAGEELAENLGKYKVDYVVTGKNKFNGGIGNISSNHNLSVTFNGSELTLNNTVSQQRWTGVRLQKPITLKSGTYTFSRSGDFENGIFLAGYYEESGIIKQEKLDIGVQKTLKKDTTFTEINFDCSTEANMTFNNTKIYLQLEYGDTATSYEPYKESIKTLYLNSPLLEGDTIEEKDGGIYHVHRYNKVVLDGSFPLSYLANLDRDNTVFFHRDNPKTSTATTKVYCDKLPYEINADVSNKECVRVNKGFQIRLNKNRFNSTDYQSEITAYLQQNPMKLIYKLATPTYELTEQQSNLAIPSYSNGHLDLASAVPVSKVNFLHFEEELTYLYPSTSYTIQFISDKAISIDITLGGTQLLAQNIVKGLNRISITTPSTLVDNKLVVDGVGANISEVVVTDTDKEFGYFEGMKSVGECEDLEVVSSNSDGTLSNTQTLTHEPLRAVGDVKDKYVLIDGKWYIERNCGVRAYQEGDIDNYITDKINTVYPLASPTYELISYNPFTVYSDITHISNNSTIPCNMTIKNTGYNCLLKPSTTYTVSSNLGLNVVTTPSTLTEDCLRFYDTDTSDVTTMKNVMVLEGDYTTGKPLPSHFSGIESAFEQEYDEEKGKYKVKIRVQNEDASKENYIEFYIDEPLRGAGTVKDKVYVKNDKVVVERKCGSVTLDGSEDENWSIQRDIYGKYRVFNSRYTYNSRYSYGYSKHFPSVPYGAIGYNYTGEGCGLENNNLRISIANAKLSSVTVAGFKQWLQQNPTTVVYQLAEPTYEEVEYNDVKLFIESFKNSTLFYNSNVPVASTINYTYSVPLVDTVAQTADISDQQDSMIIDLATQVSVMEMMLM